MDPEDVVTAFLDAGWKEIGRRPGAYVRFARPYEDGHRLLVPLDVTTGDYQDLMNAVIEELQDDLRNGVAAMNVLTRLVIGEGD